MLQDSSQHEHDLSSLTVFVSQILQTRTTASNIFYTDDTIRHTEEHVYLWNDVSRLSALHSRSTNHEK